MTIEEKLKLIGKSGCSYTCLKYGQCEVKIKCPNCGGRHSGVCRKSSIEQPSNECAIANNVLTEVLLQTCLVKPRGHNQERAIIKDHKDIILRIHCFCDAIHVVILHLGITFQDSSILLIVLILSSQWIQNGGRVYHC